MALWIYNGPCTNFTTYERMLDVLYLWLPDHHLMQPVWTWMSSSQDFGCTCVDEGDVALGRRHDRSPWMWNFIRATKGRPPTRLGYAAHVLDRGAVSFSLIQACRQRTWNEEMYEGVCVLWNANLKVLQRGRKGGVYQICQLKSNQVSGYHRSRVLLRCFQVAPLTPSESLKTVYRPQ